MVTILNLTPPINTQQNQTYLHIKKFNLVYVQAVKNSKTFFMKCKIFLIMLI